jgi:molybdate transport system substrate-binding protein
VRLPAAVAAALLLAAAATHGAEPAAPELRVFAAASTTELVNALAARFEGATVRAGFGSSSELARQITDGAPADVFVSAGPDWIDFLREQGALAGDPVVFAGNELVAIAPAGSPLAARGVTDAARLLEEGLAPGDRVAIADAGVPAGEYARQALRALGLEDAYRPLLVGQKDVRAVLHAVERGEAKAGFVYATDARIARVERLFAWPAGSHDPIRYFAAVVRTSERPEDAERFVAFLRGPAARELLAGAGFSLP